MTAVAPPTTLPEFLALVERCEQRLQEVLRTAHAVKYMFDPTVTERAVEADRTLLGLLSGQADYWASRDLRDGLVNDDAIRAAAMLVTVATRLGVV